MPTVKAWTPRKILRILRKGKKGVVRFNDYRQTFPDWRPDFTGFRLIGFDLSGFDLAYAIMSGMFCSGIRLVRSQLLRADFSETDLADAAFHNSDLSGAKFVRARMGKADFSGGETNLGGADFSNAMVWEVKFCGADLSGADFSGATVCGANFSGANLAGVIGLETAIGLADCILANAKNLPENLKLAWLEAVRRSWH